MKESKLIPEILKTFDHPTQGDDGALWRVTSQDIVICSDMLVDGVHFDSLLHSWEQIGHKALAVNLSDLAAMAATPQAALVSVAIPAQMRDSDIQEFLRGIKKLADKSNIAIIGGDTNSTRERFVISVTAFGNAHHRGAPMRSGAKPGDRLFVSGALGGSAKGRHLRFEPRNSIAIRLADTYKINAMIDLSDGLASDARHIATDSGCRLVLDESKIPIHSDVDSYTAPEDRIRRALTDGEDYELLFSADVENAKDIRREVHDVIEIGYAEAGEGLYLKKPQGGITPCPWNGFEHRTT